MMNGGPSKRIRPTSHASNPIHREQMNERKQKTQTEQPLPLNSSPVTRKLQRAEQSDSE